MWLDENSIVIIWLDANIVLNILCYHSGCVITVRYHCGGWSEEVNSCILISYMVYL
jgi:hypothetical protein